MIAIFKQTPKFDFLRHTKWFVIISTLLAVISAISLLVRGLDLGFDFRGGSELLVKFNQAELNKVVLSEELSEFLGTPVVVVSAGSSAELLISFSLNQTESGTDIKQAVTDFLIAQGYDFEVRKFDSIGPKIGAEIKQNAWYSAIVALLSVLVYMALRFNISFGVGAIAALFHDVLLTLGAFSLFKVEFNLTGVAGLLTLVGYSLNDSIVIFDRVRENLRLHPGRGLFELINLSVNETLSRTILTMATTFIVILAMYILGGASIRGFSFSFLIGIVVGTYSSVFVASPIAILFEKKSKQNT